MKLHHIGRVVKDLEAAGRYYSEVLGLTAVGEPVVDPLQKVEVRFFATGRENSPLIELISPVSQDSPVSRFLEKGEGFHHLCFEVENIFTEAERLRKKGALILGKPVPGKGHDDRLTIWIYTPGQELVELVEREAPGQ